METISWGSMFSYEEQNDNTNDSLSSAETSDICSRLRKGRLRDMRALGYFKSTK